ncbi:unnamed protein product [Angiostrongylus costaricensis]|uniref:ZP domain-containing protein n=1 Tax=Angiostrongylus costaricensis TaxID=334426 RepID=A0A158PJW6_ANGCS|nr:unnamed protein product [Angiostrongylus costaricensis]
MENYRILSLSHFTWATASECFDIDNGVIEGPKVHCGVDKIAVDITTEKPYKGRLYVQGESYNERCFQEAQDPYSEHAHFELPIGACNMRRQRTMQPRGVSFSFTLVVSFHPFFVVGIDRAFHIQCFFLESVKSLNAGFDVGWVINKKEDYLLADCLVDDGQGNQFELVDDRGCSKDSYLLPQIEYDPHSLSAFTDAPVFKYADKVQIYFTCTVQLCYRHDGGCDGVTVYYFRSTWPKSVPGLHHKRHSPAFVDQKEVCHDATSLILGRQRTLVLVYSLLVGIFDGNFKLFLSLGDTAGQTNLPALHHNPTPRKT